MCVLLCAQMSKRLSDMSDELTLLQGSDRAGMLFWSTTLTPLVEDHGRFNTGMMVKFYLKLAGCFLPKQRYTPNKEGVSWPVENVTCMLLVTANRETAVLCS